MGLARQPRTIGLRQRRVRLAAASSGCGTIGRASGSLPHVLEASQHGRVCLRLRMGRGGAPRGNPILSQDAGRHSVHAGDRKPVFHRAGHRPRCSSFVFSDRRWRRSPPTTRSPPCTLIFAFPRSARRWKRSVFSHARAFSFTGRIAVSTPSTITSAAFAATGATRSSANGVKWKTRDHDPRLRRRRS